MARFPKPRKFFPTNPNKYLGDKYEIWSRSSWETRVMIKLDEADYVAAWASEYPVVPYISPKDNRMHRYYPDFLVVTKTNEGYRVTMIEVKPLAQTKQPSPKGKKKERYINECITFSVNTAKWKAARALCKEKGWHFEIMTEKEILGK